MKEKTKSLKGFTLVEISVSALILSLIVVGIFAVLNVANISWYSDMGLVDLQQQVRRAMDSMVNEIRESKSSEITFADGNTKIIFKIAPSVYGDPWVGPINYYRDINDTNSDGVTNQIIREYPQNTRRTLANGITALSFSLNQDVITGKYLVEILLAAKKTVQEKELCFPAPCEDPQKTLKETVRLRNEPR